MLCTKCGHFVKDTARTCDACGTYLGKYGASSNDQVGVRAMRQGRVNASKVTLEARGGEAREYGDYDLSGVPVQSEQPAHRRYTAQPLPLGMDSRPSFHTAPPRDSQLVTSRHRIQKMKNAPRRSRVNWMLVAFVFFFIACIGGMGYYWYDNMSDTGMRKIARRTAISVTEDMFDLAAAENDLVLEADRTALLEEWNKLSGIYYWLTGDTFLDEGDINLAINAFRIADYVDPENYDGLMSLGNAYELNDQDDLAEVVYLDLIENVGPGRTEAYTALIRLYQAQDRRPEAGEMMLLAYQNTANESYRLQREDYIPEMPQVDLVAGSYELSQTVTLTSPQGYDVYYTTDDNAVLPDEGIKLTDNSFILGEGKVTLRAVCTSSELVSDELSVTYTISYPSPPAPKCNLAPNTYSSLREISLRPGVDSDGNTVDDSTFVYHYTIDGSTPTANSPIYDGTPIVMPSGKVTLRAICFNEYNKMSSTMEVGYEFKVSPYGQDRFGSDDTFPDFTLFVTTDTEFIAKYGQPNIRLSTTYLTLDGEASHLEYDWGYAVFWFNGSNWVLVRIQMDSEISETPRNVGFGSTEDEIVSAYKDFGQLENVDGSRSLYYSYDESGTIYYDDNGNMYIRYIGLTIDYRGIAIDYYFTGNKVTRIAYYHQP